MRAQNPRQRLARRRALQLRRISIGRIQLEWNSIIVLDREEWRPLPAACRSFRTRVVSARVSIFADSTSGWLKGLIPITDPATAVAISHVKNCPKIS